MTRTATQLSGAAYLENNVGGCVSVAADLAETMLRSGWVRIHPHCINEDTNLKPRYEAAERKAREAKRGLWQ